MSLLVKPSSRNLKLFSGFLDQLCELNVAVNNFYFTIFTLYSGPDVIFKRNKSNHIEHSSIFFQDGINIQELPVVVRKITGKEFMFKCQQVSTKDKDNNKKYMENNEDFIQLLKKAEAVEVMSSLTKCLTVKGVITVLVTLPTHDITPLMALQALKKIVDLENNKLFRSKGLRIYDKDFIEVRKFHMSRLIDIISSTEFPFLLQTAFKIITRDNIGKKSLYVKHLCEEVICRASEGHYTILQICEIIGMMASIDNGYAVDNLWNALTVRETEINTPCLFLEVCRTLPSWRKSRKVVLHMLERCASNVWWQLSNLEITELISILSENNLNSRRLLRVVVRWMTSNLSCIPEADFIDIVNAFWSLDYKDSKLQKIFCVYLSQKTFHTANPTFIAAVMEYCGKYRIRSTEILERAVETISHNGESMSPVILKTIFVPFGFLNYLPKEPVKFWMAIERNVRERFLYFHPEDILEIMLACLYLNKHPFNFIKKIFNPYFLDRALNNAGKNQIPKCRNILKIIDTAMSLECEQYKGPLLPRDTRSQILLQDGRVRRIVNHIKPTVESLVGDPARLSVSVIPPQLPVVDLYLIDILIHPTELRELLHNLTSDVELYTAILILLPEHFCSESNHVIGPQIMRQRHLRKIGLKVSTLNYKRLCEIRMEPAKLKYYIETRLRIAQET